MPSKMPLDTLPNCRSSQTPPSSPSEPHLCQCHLEPPVALHLAQLFKEITTITKATQVTSDPATAPQAVETQDSGNAQSEEARSRASRLEFKTVDEVWDTTAYKYKVVESSTPTLEMNELDEYIFVVRMRIDKKTGDPTHFIDIKSEPLRDMLRTVLQNVKGICLREDQPTVERNILYHYLPELEAYPSVADNVPLCGPLHLKHLDLLVGYIKDTYASATQRLIPLLQNGEITYDLLWALFKPNCFVYTTCFGTGKPRCIKYDFGEERETSQRVKYFRVEGRYLDFDGKVFGEACVVLCIERFRGAKQINLLNAFPLEYHQNESKIRAHLTECGRKFVSLMGVHHRQFRGPAFFMHKGEPVQVSVNSRITIDATFFRQINPNYARPSIDKPPKQKSSDLFFDIWGASSTTITQQPDKVESNGMEPTEMDEGDFLVCSPTVLGFSFADKMWLEFAVADTRDIEWNTLSFDCLVMPDAQKEMILALAETHMGRLPTLPFDDVIEGKGQGLNVLLHGPPGVGKTLTAEVLSEYLQKPLYSISAGELGTDAKKLEDQLSIIFQLGSRWNALLLLDEADVFLEQRTTENLVRHGLVSVFLRRLEYFRGILVLTTNRVNNFDEAILSRIHIQLKYGELNADARRKVWKIFLGKAHTSCGAASISEKELGYLVKETLNGRQIKNTVATARALAAKKKAPVSFSHLQTIIAAGEMFDRDFRGTHHSERLYT